MHYNYSVKEFSNLQYSEINNSILYVKMIYKTSSFSSYFGLAKDGKIVEEDCEKHNEKHYKVLYITENYNEESYLAQLKALKCFVAYEFHEKYIKRIKEDAKCLNLN